MIHSPSCVFLLSISWRKPPRPKVDRLADQTRRLWSRELSWARTTTTRLTGAIHILLVEAAFYDSALLILKALCPTSSSSRAGAAPICAVHEQTARNGITQGRRMVSAEACSVGSGRVRKRAVPATRSGLFEQTSAQGDGAGIDVMR